MKYSRSILHRLVFIGFTKIGRMKPLYEVVGCFQSAGAKQTICLTGLQTTFSSYAYTDSEFFCTMYDCMTSSQSA